MLSTETMEEALAAAQECAPDDEERQRALVQEMVELAERLQGLGLSPWSLFRFGVRSLAQASGSSEQLMAHLSSLEALVQALQAQQLDAERCLQQGVAPAAWENPALLGPLLELSVRLARSGTDPRELLRHVGPALVWADASALPPLERFALALAEQGVGPYWPIFAGVAAVARATGEPALWASALPELSSLVSALSLAGSSPYPVLEYGVSAAFASATHSRWLLPEILPLAAVLAAQGLDPSPILQRGLPALAQIEPVTAQGALSLARQAAEEGVDPAPVLYALLPALAHSEDVDASQLSSMLGEGVQLAGLLAERELRPLLTFDEGLHLLWGRPRVELEGALSLALAMARAGRDPGPMLVHGLARAFGNLEQRPELRAPVLRAALRLARDGLDPWGLLEWGTPALVCMEATDEQRLELLSRLEGLVRELCALGADPRHVLLFTVHQPARSMGYARDRVLALVDRLAGAHRELVRAGLDPGGLLVQGLPRVAEDAPGALELAFSTASALASRRIDPGPLLSNALPAFVALGEPQKLLESTFRLLDLLPGSSVRLAAVLPRLGSASAQALRSLIQLAGSGVDAIEPLEALLSGQDELQPEWFEVAERELRAAHADGIPLAGQERTGLARVAEGAGGRPARLERAMGAWRKAARSLLEAGRSDLWERGLLEWGAGAASAVAGGEEALFEEALDRFLALTRALPAEQDLDRLFRVWSRSLSELCVHDPVAFEGLLGSLLRLGTSPAAPETLLEETAPLARAVAAGQAARMASFLEDLNWLLDTGRLQELEDEGGLRALGRQHALCAREPGAWRELLLPVLQSQRHATSDLLRSLRRMEAWITGNAALSLLRAVVTQEGVRAHQLFEGFLLPALQDGVIASLSDEREQILAFLREVPMAHPHYYRRYVEIVSSGALSAAERRQQIEALHHSALSLVASIREGELPDDAFADPMLAEALFHVFPPACSVSSQSYLALVRWFADHPGHTARLPPVEQEVELQIGGYHLREGASVDMSAWQPLWEAVRAVHGGLSAPELAELGAAALRPASSRDELLRGLYAHHRALRDLPEELGDAASLLAYREFLADSAREILHDALRALRQRDPERYERQVRARLGRRITVGRGLLRAVGRTLESWQQGSLSREVALQRLGRQLRGFELDSEEMQQRLLSCEPAQLEALLQGLGQQELAAAPGEEHLRLLSDLAGQELAAMQRELFGDRSQPGKLEYRRSRAGPSLRLRFELTKRRAHAPLGYCEGVCTARDQALWDDERFLQVALWGPDQRARGGVHLWVVDAPDGRHLALPGINPSLGLLSEVGAEAMLDAVLAFARLARDAWQLGQVLVPTSPMISSNRGALRELLASRGYERRTLPRVPFPYAFEEAWIV